MSEDEALELEEFIISNIGSNFIEEIDDGPLCNMVKGGTGGNTYRIKMRDADNNVFIGDIRSDEFLSGEWVGALKGTKFKNPMKILTCPYCDKSNSTSAGITGMKKYHFKNCKNYK